MGPPLAVRGRMLRPARKGLCALLKLPGMGPDADRAIRPPRLALPLPLSGAEFGATGGRRGGRRTPAVVRGRAMGEVVMLAVDWRLSADAGRPLIARARDRRFDVAFGSTRPSRCHTTLCMHKHPLTGTPACPRHTTAACASGKQRRRSCQARVTKRPTQASRRNGWRRCPAG